MPKDKPKEYKDIKFLIREECANYFSDNATHYCCSKDGKCIFFTNSEFPRCKWFEQSVLPIDKILQRSYAEDRKIAFKSLLPKKR
jgi:hypothetical protein